MINEDGTTQSRGGDGGQGPRRQHLAVRRHDRQRHRRRHRRLRVAELDPPGRDGVAVGPGVWETSGIIDASRLFGRDTWLFDVQAHPPTAAPATNTVEDGQLLLMTGPAGRRRRRRR